MWKCASAAVEKNVDEEYLCLESVNVTTSLHFCHQINGQCLKTHLHLGTSLPGNKLAFAEPMLFGQGEVPARNG